MAELVAIGTVSSFVQLADFTAKLATLAWKLIKDSENGIEEVAELERLIQDHEVVAQFALDNDFGDGRTTTDDSQTTRIAKRCANDAQELIEQLKELRMTEGASGWGRIKEGAKKAVKFQRAKDEILRQHNHIQERSQLLSSTLRERGQTRLTAILESLAFEGMTSRERSIKQAHASTYEWAFDANFSLATWLASGNGLYWVTGKPGAGKSTLMKFIYQHGTTRNLLQQWAGHSSIVLASFYFWWMGSGPQKSIEGLLRRLLHTLILDSPEQAEEIFPEFFLSHWSGKSEKQRREKMERFILKLEWTEAKLLARIRRLVAGKTYGRKFCLFIDGLDEHHGDQLSLIEFLYEISQNTGVKLCVSSRPWNIFKNAFGESSPYLRLHELTKPDIRTYTHHSIRSASTSALKFSASRSRRQGHDLDNIDKLVTEIVDKAEGVFFWVFLVVKSVTRGIAEGDPTILLRDRVRDFPPDLFDFFETLIFDRVDPIYNQRMCQMLAWAYDAVEINDGLVSRSSYLNYWIMMHHPDILNKGLQAYDAGLQELSQVDLDEMALETEQFLSASCKDLLSMDRDEYYSHFTKVSFMHRTVFDFLGDPRMCVKAAVMRGTSHLFKSGRIIHLLNLAQLKYTRPGDPRMIGYVSEVASFSLSSRHQDLCEEYVAAFADILTTYFGHYSPLSGVSMRAVKTLIVFRQGIFDARTATEATELDIENDDIYHLLCAALFDGDGCNSGIDQIDGHLLRSLMNLASRRGLKVFAMNTQSPTTCYRTLCEAFLHRWAVACRSVADEDDNGDHPVILSGFEIIKLFMEHYNIMGVRVCLSDTSTPHHIHDWVTAAEVLETYVPANLLPSWVDKYGLRKRKRRRSSASGSTNVAKRQLIEVIGISDDE